MPSENSIQLSSSKLLYAILGATIQLHVARLQDLARKAGFRPEQPRVPAGHPDGGEWVDEDGDADLILIGGDPEDISKFPEKPPPTTRERNVWAIRVAKYLLETNVQFQTARVANWIWDHARDRIIAYQDEPKYLDQLRRAVAEPKPGHDIHHIVEQTPARRDGFAGERIEDWRNLVRIPTYRHWQITGWYGKPNRDFGGQSPWDYLRGNPGRSGWMSDWMPCDCSRC